MNMLSIALVALLVCANLQAQNPAKLSPESEAALKERVSKFWDGFVQGKFRQSDAYVAEEAKDDFFSWPKKKIRGYTIDAVHYDEKLKEAKVVTVADTNFVMMGRGAMDIKQPVETYWKLENGEWCWFLPKGRLRDTPFGKMEVSSQGGDGAASASAMMNAKPDLKQLMALVRPDRETAKFTLGKAGKETIEFTNGMQGIVTLSMDTPPGEDLKFELNPMNVPRESKAQLVITYTPEKIKEPFKRTLRVGVAQTGKVYSIVVSVEPEGGKKTNQER